MTTTPGGPDVVRSLSAEVLSAEVLSAEVLSVEMPAALEASADDNVDDTGEASVAAAVRNECTARRPPSSVSSVHVSTARV